MDNAVATYRFEDLKEGQSFDFMATVCPEDIDRYASLSGDVSPIHMDAGFARKRGFAGRVAHGGLLGSYVSRMVGVHLPGRNALMHSMNLKFLKPVYAGDMIRVCAHIDQLSPAAQAVVLKVTIEDTKTGEIHTRGKVQVGFTSDGAGSESSGG